MKTFNISIFLVTLALLLINGSAFASDRKVHHGSMCQPYTHSYAPHLVADTLGAYNKSSSNYILVTCPVVRDNTQNTNGTRLAYVRFKSSGGKSLYCALYSRGAYGKWIDSNSDSKSSDSPSWLYIDVKNGAVLGSYAIFCSLPPKARIYNYDIDEW